MEALVVLVIPLSFALAIGFRWRSTVVIGPAVALIWCVLTIEGDAAAQDMHGLGYLAGAFFAILTVIVWLLGRWVRHLQAKARAAPD
jgi:hypothetical protein